MDSEALRRYKEMEAERMAINVAHLERGVSFVDLNTAYIGKDVKIGAGTLIGPCVTLEGQTVIGENCLIGQNSRIVDSTIEDGVEVQSSVITRSKVGKNTKLGPFVQLRPDSNIGEGCKIGNFVEVKNSTLGNGTKASHLTYIGDSDVGSEVNLGCGVVFVNYDGSKKYRSTVGDNAFIGCNSNLVSPVHIGNGAYIAAGTTVTEDVDEDALYIGRAKASQKPGWVSAKGILKKK